MQQKVLYTDTFFFFSFLVVWYFYPAVLFEGDLKRTVKLINNEIKTTISAEIRDEYCIDCVFSVGNNMNLPPRLPLYLKLENGFQKICMICVACDFRSQTLYIIFCTAFRRTCSFQVWGSEFLRFPVFKWKEKLTSQAMVRPTVAGELFINGTEQIICSL